MFGMEPVGPALADRIDGEIYMVINPGAFVYRDSVIAYIDAPPVEKSEDMPLPEDTLRGAVTIGPERNFDQDPRFGASVLAEIASRALSPGINDPGTAIDVIGRAVRLLAIAAEPGEPQQEVACPRVHIPPIAIGDLFDDLFTPIARDGAGVVEIGVRLQKAMLILSRLGPPDFAENAARHSRLALQRASRGLTLEHDLAVLRDLAAQLGAP